MDKCAQAVGAQDVRVVRIGRPTALVISEAPRALIVHPGEGCCVGVMLGVGHPVDEHDPIEHVLDNPVLVEQAHIIVPGSQRVPMVELPAVPDQQVVVQHPDKACGTLSGRTVRPASLAVVVPFPRVMRRV